MFNFLGPIIIWDLEKLSSQIFQEIFTGSYHSIWSFKKLKKEFPKKGSKGNRNASWKYVYL